MVRSKKIRFGVIGSGGMGRRRVWQLLNASPDVEVVAAVEPVRENIKLLEQTTGKPVIAYTRPEDYRKMIEEQELDAVGIFSPHSVHYEQARFALEHDKHVLIEKPMVCGSGKAIETAKMARDKGLVYLICYQRHFMPQFVKARDMVQNGVIGKVDYFYAYMAQDYSAFATPRLWRGDPKYSGGGQLNDSGSHYQDMLLWLTGQVPRSAEGYIDKYCQGKKSKIEMNGMFNVELSGGMAGRLVILGDYVRGFVDDVKIRGDKGVVMITSAGGLSLAGPDQKKPRQISCKLPKGYPVDPCDNFVRLLTGRTKKNHVEPFFGAKVALLTDMLLEAGKTGRKSSAASVLKKAGYTLKDLK